MKRRVWLLLTAVLVLTAMCATALADAGQKLDFQYDIGVIEAHEGVLPEEVEKAQNCILDGTFSADYVACYQVKDSVYTMKFIHIGEPCFAGKIKGYLDFVDGIDVSWEMSRSGEVTITFAYQFKYTLEDHTTVYMMPETTVTTFQLPAE